MCVLDNSIGKENFLNLAECRSLARFQSAAGSNKLVVPELSLVDKNIE